MMSIRMFPIVNLLKLKSELQILWSNIMSEDVRVIKLSPIFQSKIWGGRNLAQYFKNVPDGKIGECWLISAHSHGDTIVENEPFKGQTLSRVYKKIVIYLEMIIIKSFLY